jgi:hypothetical protein
MSRDHLLNAVRDGIPLVISMADGRQYPVATRQDIIVGPAHVVVIDKQVIPHVLPLLTMTGISYRKAAKIKKA